LSTPTFIDDTGFNLAVGPNGQTGLSGWLSFYETAYTANYGSTVNLDPDSPDGQWLATLAEVVNGFELVTLQVYLGRSPAGAIGAGLARLVQLNGITKKSAQFSTAPITLSGTPGTVIAAGKLISSQSDPTIPPFAIAAPYTIGGGGTVTGNAICTAAGPVNVAAGDLTVIQTPVTGWTSVTNTSPAAPGILLEQDPDLRARRALSPALPSQAMLDGLEAALANLPGVSQAAVYENPTGATDSKGLPPHSIRAIVNGGVNSAIANAIWTKSSMGATKVGAVTYTLTDAQGNPQTMAWDVPVTTNVYITVKLSPPVGAPPGWTPDPSLIAELQDAIFAYGQSVARIGQPLPWANFATPINGTGLVGGLGQPTVVAFFLGSAPSPTLQQDLVVPYDHLPYFGAVATAQISVVGS
jgi:uncharacterized phage protein gp47/JayE